AAARLSISAGGQPCTLATGAQMLDRHTDGVYTVLPVVFKCPAEVATIEVAYRLFADVDAQHKGLVRVNHRPAKGGQSINAVLGADQPHATLRLSEDGQWRNLLAFVGHGTWHIWIGYDHILFLCSLLLPAVLVRRAQSWEGAQRFPDALRDVVRIVSAFTLAHSITLSAAGLGWVSLPSRLVESVIAASVVLAALNNLRPQARVPRWAAAFAFGLIHGFGFASVLADLGLPTAGLAWALLGFNLGVELGQLAIVALFLPLAFLLRHTRFYRHVVVGAGSLAIAFVASVWLAERALDVRLL
ncbi:MAG: HupE/UreJ family protein, partial [Gammaproteobacteria bacterium]